MCRGIASGNLGMTANERADGVTRGKIFGESTRSQRPVPSAPSKNNSSILSSDSHFADLILVEVATVSGDEFLEACGTRPRHKCSSLEARPERLRRGATVVNPRSVGSELHGRSRIVDYCPIPSCRAFMLQASHSDTCRSFVPIDLPAFLALKTVYAWANCTAAIALLLRGATRNFTVLQRKQALCRRPVKCSWHSGHPSIMPVAADQRQWLKNM